MIFLGLLTLGEKISAKTGVEGYWAGTQECPLQVCQLSKSSESTHFLSLRGDVVY